MSCPGYLLPSVAGPAARPAAARRDERPHGCSGTRWSRFPKRLACTVHEQAANRASLGERLS